MKNCESFWLGATGQLFGIRHVPQGDVFDTGVVILNAGLLHNVGPFRLHVLLAEELAAAGFAVLRIDQSGKGESSRRKGVRRNDSVLLDYDDALANLSLLGVKRIVVIGLCSGADDGMYIAANRDSLAGLVSLDGYAQRNAKFRMKHFASKLFSTRVFNRIASRIFRLIQTVDTSSGDAAGLDIRDWAEDDEMKRRLSSLLSRDGKALSIFTDGQDYYNYMGQLRDNLRGTAQIDGLTELHFRGVDHTFTTEHHRRALLKKIVDWFKQSFEN